MEENRITIAGKVMTIEKTKYGAGKHLQQIMRSFMYELTRYFWFIAIGMPPIMMYYGIKYWKMRKTPGYEWYEFFYVMPLMYVTIMYSSISTVITNEVGLIEAISIWICSASLSITSIRIFIRKKKAGTYEPGKEKWFIPGIVFFSLFIIGMTAFVVAVALE